MTEPTPHKSATPRLHPDRNFDTIAAAAGDPCVKLAQLELGARCALLDPQRAGRLLELLRSCEPAAVRAREEAGLDVRQTLAVDGSSGRLRVEPLRSWIQETPCDASLRVVLNSSVGPYLCRPLQMGADVVLEDLAELLDWNLLPVCPCVAVVARTDAAWQRFCDAAGALLAASSAETTCVMAVHELGGIEGRVLGAALQTLSLATQRRSDNALVAANYLAAHPAVAWVSYPGLAQDAANDAARRTLEHGFGPYVSFGLVEPVAAGAMATWVASPGPMRSGVAVLPGDDPGGTVNTATLVAGLESPLDVISLLEDRIGRR